MTEEFTCFYDNYWNCQLPVHGSDSSAFLHMGIEFGSFADGDLLRDARLPQGWKKEPAKENWSNIVDERGCIRAKVFEHKDKALMYPERRFNCSREKHDLAVVFHVWDSDSNKSKRICIFKKRFVLPDKKRFQKAYDQKVEEFTKLKVCEKWLDETFPKWNDYNAYWGEGKVTVDPRTLKVIMKKEDSEKDSEKEYNNENDR